MQTACRRCQAFLARILYFQLGRTHTISFDDTDAFYVTPITPRLCMVCRLFSDYLDDDKQLFVRGKPCEATQQSTSQAQEKSCFVRGFTRPLMEQLGGDVAIEVELENEEQLRVTLQQISNAGQLGVQGPILTQDVSLDFNERQSALAQMTELLTACDRWHAQCKQAHQTYKSPLPSRVLDLRGLNSGDFRLVDSATLNDKYAALSHCWGDGPSFTTTRATLAQRQQKITIAELPLLFRDAVYCARELDIDYLWIDALCIVQDDYADWEREAARMANVFRNAYVTLAATAQSGSNHALFPEPDYAMLRFKVVSTGAVLTWKFNVHPNAKPRDDILFAPLNKRGWVLQELMLSRRTLHFSKHQMYFHCSELARSADGSFKNDSGQLSTLGWWYGPDAKLTPEQREKPDRYQVIKATQQLPAPASLAMLWWRLVEDYSTRKLTFLSDKLIALSGIAAAFKQYDRTLSYVAGMWEQDVVRSLLWHAEDDSPETDRPLELFGIPTWSWASIDQPVRMPRGYGVTTSSRALVSVEKAEVTFAGESIASRVLGGALHLRSSLILSTHRLSEDTDQGRYDNPIALLNTTRDGHSRLVGRGRADVKYDLLPADLWLLPVFEEDTTGELSVLLMQLVKNSSFVDGRFQRIGIGMVEGRKVACWDHTFGQSVGGKMLMIV